MSSETFGEWIKRQRKEKDMTLEDLAERVYGDRTKYPNLQRYESGKRNTPFDVAMQIADGLGVPLPVAALAWNAANGVPITYIPDDEGRGRRAAYDNLEPRNKRIVDDMADLLLEAQKEGSIGKVQTDDDVQDTNPG